MVYFQDEKGNRTPEEQELPQLRKENQQLRMENDVSKEAALIFARKENGNGFCFEKAGRFPDAKSAGS